MRRRLLPGALLCAAVGLGLVLGQPAAAVVVPLNAEFDSGAMGDFGSVEVTQNGDNIDFEIMLGPDLNQLAGGAPDLHKFYFNLVGSFTGLSIVADDAPNTPYTIAPAQSVQGGAGASFDFEVSFGNGAGASGNGTLGSAAFTVAADQPLILIFLSETSDPNNVDPAKKINFAIHVQETAAFAGFDSETVGGGTPTGVIPEPATLLLTGAGLFGLAALGRRRRR